MASTTDPAIIRVDEILAEKGIEEALDYLQEALKTRKKSQIGELELLITKEIDLSVAYLNRKHIKEDLSYFRNVTQYENGKVLEKVLTYFRDAVEQKFQAIEKDIKGKVNIEDVETGYIAEDLLLRAFEDEQELENQDKLGPCIKFMMEGYEIILDVLRSNSTMFNLYNTTAEHSMAFCVKNNRKSEFKKITDTLSKHLKNIFTQKPETLKNIPNPIYIEHKESFEHLLTLRLEALNYTLKLDNWSDSLKIIKDIKELDKFRRSMNFDGLKPFQKASFLEKAAELFKKAKFYLFYAGSLCSADKKYRGWKARDDTHKANFADRIVLAYLMIPLDDNASNFKPIGFNILRDTHSNNRKEFYKYCDLIDQARDLSREVILKWIVKSNLLTICSKEVKTFFSLMEENTTKPAELSQNSEKILNWLQSHEEYSQFYSEIRTNLTLRIFQQLGKIFNVIKFDSFKKIFGFLDFNECEKAIVEGNRTYVTSQHTNSKYSQELLGNSSSTVTQTRERLFHIKIDPEHKKIIFNALPENQLVAKSLDTFRQELRTVDTMINVNRVIGQTEIQEIARRVCHQMDIEYIDATERYEEEQKIKNEKRKEEEERKKKEIDEANVTAAERQKRLEQEQYYLERKMLKEEVLREKGEYLRTKIRECVNYLVAEKIRAIGSIPLKNVWSLDPEIDNVYKIVKENVDAIYAKKQEEAHIWANKLIKQTDLTERAKRVFEKPMLEEDLKNRNETEIVDLKENLEKKHANDVTMKHLLISSQESRDLYIKAEMKIREEELKQQTAEYIAEKTEELKNFILSKAKSSLRKEENKKAMEKRRKELEERDRKRREEEGLPPISTASSGEDAGFGRAGFGVEKQPTVSSYSRSDRKPRDSDGPKKFSSNSGGFGRSMFNTGEKEENKDSTRDGDSDRPRGPPKFESKKPTFSNAKKTDGPSDWKRNLNPSREDKNETKEAKKVIRSKKKKTTKEKDAGVGRFSSNW